jgi:hypothetical protein
MAAANASARGQRAAILASPLHELTGFYLAVDCLAPRCNGERTFAVAELATFYGRDSTVGQVLRRMRCSGACGGRVGAAWLDPQCPGPSPPCGAARAGGEGVAMQPFGCVFRQNLSRKRIKWLRGHNGATY